MYQHHKESLENLVRYFEGQEGVIALIFGGSVAKGTERPDSDLDAVIIVTEKRYEKQKAIGSLAEVITGHCTYEGGYFDIKYKTKEFLALAAQYGSEPTRSSFYKARVLFSADSDIEPLLQKINTFPIDEQERKREVLWANVSLNQKYFMGCLNESDSYMRLHVVSEIVYSIYRLILQENEVLFPCNRRLEEYVGACENKPDRILELAREYMERMDHESCRQFVDAYIDWTKFPVENNNDKCLTPYVKAYEEWWLYPHAPFVNEW